MKLIKKPESLNQKQMSLIKKWHLRTNIILGLFVVTNFINYIFFTPVIAPSFGYYDFSYLLILISFILFSLMGLSTLIYYFVVKEKNSIKLLSVLNLLAIVIYPFFAKTPSGIILNPIFFTYLIIFSIIVSLIYILYSIMVLSKK